MTNKQPQNFQRRINNYVPRMDYAHDVIDNAPVRFSLGTPILGTANDILAAQSIVAAASTTVLIKTVLDGTYGRTVTVRKPSGAATGTVTITGRDYLGQPMREAIATVASTTVIVQGRKAFKFIDEIGWTAHAGSTLDVGTGTKFGVPYVVENFMYAIENGVRVERTRDVVWLSATNANLDPAGVTSVRAPCKGNVIAVKAVISTVIAGANENLTFDVNGGAAIAGLAMALPTAGSAIGQVFERAVANNTANCAVLAGDTININNDGASSGGAAQFMIGIQPEGGIWTDAILTDPQTLTTGDPRGLYEAFMTLDGVRTLDIVFTANRFINANGRGGLHGIQHFFV